MSIRVAVRCVTGPVRRDNQDHWLISDFDRSYSASERGAWDLPSGQRGALLAVADGMGGHRGGHEAARLALDALAGPMGEERDGAAAVAEGMSAANAAVHAQSLTDPLLAGMGTTLTAALCREGALVVGHVGDTRLYLRRGRELSRLTTDHSLPEQVLRLDREAARRHPSRNVLTQCIGGNDPSVCVEVVRVRLAEGDVVLLCSDGLHGAVPDAEIATCLAEPTMEAAAERLLDLALKRGTTDNVTALVARFGRGGLPESAPLAVEKLAEVVWDEDAGRPRVRPG